ncbi:MAG: TadE/TadG family type IV pilus assembly protein [Paracoccaceae bacterium]
MLDALRTALTRFHRDERGWMTAEAVLILPVLIWWYLGSLVFFDAYDARSINLKASYTISDLFSRNLDGEIDANEIEAMGDMFDYLTANHGADGAIRVSLVHCSDDCDQPGRELSLDWSYGTDGKPALTGADLSIYDEVIPMMALGDRVFVIETFSRYEPPFNVGLTEDSYSNVVVTRPRFVAAPCLVGTTCP